MSSNTETQYRIKLNTPCPRYDNRQCLRAREQSRQCTWRRENKPTAVIPRRASCVSFPDRSSRAINDENELNELLASPTAAPLVFIKVIRNPESRTVIASQYITTDEIKSELSNAAKCKKGSLDNLKCAVSHWKEENNCESYCASLSEDEIYRSFWKLIDFAKKASEEEFSKYLADKYLPGDLKVFYNIARRIEDEILNVMDKKFVAEEDPEEVKAQAKLILFSGSKKVKQFLKNPRIIYDKELQNDLDILDRELPDNFFFQVILETLERMSKRKNYSIRQSILADELGQEKAKQLKLQVPRSDDFKRLYDTLLNILNYERVSMKDIDTLLSDKYKMRYLDLLGSTTTSSGHGVKIEKLKNLNLIQQLWQDFKSSVEEEKEEGKEEQTQKQKQRQEYYRELDRLIKLLDRFYSVKQPINKFATLQLILSS